MSEDDSVELYRKYRPKMFSELMGQKEAVAVLAAMGKADQIPHALLLTGPSGCGKTTVARILRPKLKCAEADFTELNAADTRGIDTIREIAQKMRMAPMSGGMCRIYLIDECHALTGDAQSALLKLLEDTPAHVYFMLATTDPGKLKKTIITRCTEIKFKPITPSALRELVISVAAAEGKQLDKEVAEKIAECADGSGRKALVLLHQVINIADPDEQRAAVAKALASAGGFEIAKALLNKATWSTLADMLKECPDEPETVRRTILGYMQAVLLGGRPNPRAAEIMVIFADNFYDTGKAGLVLACYEATVAK